MRLIILLFSLSFLSGCIVGNLQQLQFLDPQANDFDSALAAEYLAYATAEKEQGHPLVAENFAAKGLRAWRGEKVIPETVEASTPLPLNRQQQSTRDLLMALLTEDVKRVVPQQAARAQLLFDCWIIQAQRKNDTQQLCRDELQQAIITLRNVASTLALTSETTHILDFAPGSGKLGKRALSQIDSMVKELEGGAPYTIELDGDVQTPMAKSLFERRMAEIRKAFKARGVGEERIQPKEVHNDKAVYLSCDDTIEGENKVRVTISIFGQSRPQGEGKP